MYFPLDPQSAIYLYLQLVLHFLANFIISNVLNRWMKYISILSPNPIKLIHTSCL